MVSLEDEAQDVSPPRPSSSFHSAQGDFLGETMELLTGIFTAFGLSASAGLNAYIPLLVVGLLARYTNLLTLSQPWDTLASPWIILLLCGLIIVENAGRYDPPCEPRQRPDPDLHPSRCGSHRFCSQRQRRDRR
jgi:ABC-type nickel/cobalt efflux system permease component RcnA